MPYPINIIRNVGRPTFYSKILEEFAIEIIEWMQNYMQENNRIATGKSINSFELLTMDNELVISAASSVPFAVKGRKSGGFPPVQMLKDWIIAKGVQPYPDNNGRVPTLNQLAFLISRGIAKKGTKPPKLTSQNISAVINSKSLKYMDRIAEEQAMDMRSQFLNTFSRSANNKN